MSQPSDDGFGVCVCGAITVWLGDGEDAVLEDQPQADASLAANAASPKLNPQAITKVRMTCLLSVHVQNRASGVRGQPEPDNRLPKPDNRKPSDGGRFGVHRAVELIRLDGRVGEVGAGEVRAFQKGAGQVAVG